MPLENLFTDEATANAPEQQPKLLYQKFGVSSNPFPSAGQTSGHPHMPTQADKQVDAAVKTFYSDRKSHVISITASQGIGKTNLLNAYENALREKLSPHGFFVIRYVPDPEPFFDPLIRSIFENLGEDYLRRSINALDRKINQKNDIDKLLEFVRMSEIKTMLKALLEVESEEKRHERISLAYQWLLGLPIRKNHQTELGVYFRLDTVEAKTRALRDIVYFGAEMETLEGIFILLDELEKQDFSLSKTIVLRYLSALRALIDALPKYLFLMVALTTDALNRYREMLPAIKGRLANEVQLLPIRNEEEAVKLFDFYLNEAKEEATRKFAQNKQLKPGSNVLLHEDSARLLFHQLLKVSNIKGVRQRDYLNGLYEKADESINEFLSASV
ncbi:MAG TPA: hypothetical protein V6D25_17955 [Leptolyngbyaceae cyanobacterium]